MKSRSPRRSAAEYPQKGTLSERRGWFPRILVLVAVLFVGTIAGAALALLFFDGPPDDGPAEVEMPGGLEEGSGMPGEDSVEAAFARDMIVHHAQAVEMAEIVRDRTGSEEIRNLAAGIALAQQAEIGQMRGWLQVWGLQPAGAGSAMSWMGHPTEGRMLGMASPEDIDNLQKVLPEEADIRFLQLLIPHHEAALQMAEAVLEETDRPEVKQLATAIIASQQAEISKIQNFLRNRGVPIEVEPSAT